MSDETPKPACINAPFLHTFHIPLYEPHVRVCLHCGFRDEPPAVKAVVAELPLEPLTPVVEVAQQPKAAETPKAKEDAKKVRWW